MKIFTLCKNTNRRELLNMQLDNITKHGRQPDPVTHTPSVGVKV